MGPDAASRITLVLLGMPLLLAACGSRDPCPGVSVGAKFQVNVGELIENETGADTTGKNCAIDWGFAPGSVLQADIVTSSGRDVCLSGQAELTGNTAFNVVRSSDYSAGGGALIESHYTLSQGSCLAEAQINVGCSGPCLSSTGGSCTCRMSIVTYQDRGDCPTSCAVVASASVTRL
ncbi:MAG: hypothetical protein ABJB12_03510 [Pseudomonadota bacterium]